MGIEHHGSVLDASGHEVDLQAQGFQGHGPYQDLVDDVRDPNGLDLGAADDLDHDPAAVDPQGAGAGLDLLAGGDIHAQVRGQGPRQGGQGRSRVHQAFDGPA